MVWRWLAAIACLGLSSSVAAVVQEKPSCPVATDCRWQCSNEAGIQQSRPLLTNVQLEKLAQSITVRVVSPAVVGSGVLVSKKGHRYQVLTNAHNLLGTDEAQVQTGDGATHHARRIPRQNWGKKDVALLEFQSDRLYQVAEWSPQLAKKGLEIVAAGFDFERQEVTVSNGQVSQLLDQPMRQGYQLGYSSRINQGMSGGPILDRTGLLLGINGMTAYPILNRAYVFADGSRPNNTTIKQLRRSNWGIPLRDANGCLRLDYSPTLD
jgi:S1-C subfamily serine protease